MIRPRDLGMAGATLGAVAVTDPSTPAVAFVGAVFLCIGVVAELSQTPKDPKR